MLKLVGNWDLAEDILEETFLKLYKSDLEEKGKLKNWLFRVATNLSLKALRTRKYEIMDCDGLFAKQRENANEDLETHIEVQKTLMKIPETQRVVIVLKFYQGMKYKEISEILGCPLGTIKTRMYHGLKKMKKLLSTP